MGGDAQPQILLQLLARTLIAGEDAGTAVTAPRWSLTREASSGFDVWETADPPIVALEHDAPGAWQERPAPPWLPRLAQRSADDGFGHAQMIRVTADGMLCGAADPRTRDGACIGL